MIALNTILKFRIAVLLIGIIIGMTGTTKGAALQSTGGKVNKKPATSQQIHVVENADADADRNSETPVAMTAESESSEDQEEFEALMAILEEETEIATKIKMNNDYVPGMVTVLHGEHLEALGIKTVAEALSMVPGIQLSRINSGEPTVKTRGISFPFNAGNIKVMLNSIGLSRESSGINSSLLLTPVAQIERIEVIRGPGSSIYGDFAMAGVVNIITKNTDGGLFGSAGNNESNGGGGHYTYRDEKKSLGIGLNLSMIDDGENATAVNKNPDEERLTGVFNFDYKNFSFIAEGMRKNIDFETLPAPSPPIKALRQLSHMEESWAMEGRQTIDLNRGNLEVYLSYLKNNGNIKLNAGSKF